MNAMRNSKTQVMVNKWLKILFIGYCLFEGFVVGPEFFIIAGLAIIVFACELLVEVRETKKGKKG